MSQQTLSHYSVYLYPNNKPNEVQQAAQIQIRFSGDDNLIELLVLNFWADSDPQSEAPGNYESDNALVNANLPFSSFSAYHALLNAEASATVLFDDEDPAYFKLFRS